MTPEKVIPNLPSLLNTISPSTFLLVEGLCKVRAIASGKTAPAQIRLHPKRQRASDDRAFTRDRNKAFKHEDWHISAQALNRLLTAPGAAKLASPPIWDTILCAAEKGFKIRRMIHRRSGLDDQQYANQWSLPYSATTTKAKQITYPESRAPNTAETLTNDKAAHGKWKIQPISHEVYSCKLIHYAAPYSG